MLTLRPDAERLLVVDDDPSLRTLLAQTLVSWGYSVTEAGSVGEALSAVRTPGFSVILTDLEMPGLAGFGFARQIRSQERARGWLRVPIVAISSHTSDAYRKQCERVEMDALLGKPFDWDAVARTVESMCQLRRSERRRALRYAKEPDVAALVPRFLEARRRDLDVMEAHLRCGDAVGLANLAHRLKGSGSSFGFPKLTAIGTALERAAAQRAWKTCRRALDALAVHLDRATVATAA